MKLFCKIAAVALLAAITFVSAQAQGTPAGAQPSSSQSSSAAPDSKIAVINTEAFGDPKSGIARLIAVFTTVEREFKPRRDELAGLKTQYDQLVRDIEATRNLADEKALAAKTDQATTLKSSIDRKAEDGQRDLDKRLQTLTDPIYRDLTTALRAYASQRGISVLLDVSKMTGAVFVVNDTVDITAAFIADYNQRNPAPAAAATPAKP